SCVLRPWTATTCSMRHAPTCCAASAATRKPRPRTTLPALLPRTRSNKPSSTRSMPRSSRQVLTEDKETLGTCRTDPDDHAGLGTCRTDPDDHADLAVLRAAPRPQNAVKPWFQRVRTRWKPGFMASGTGARSQVGDSVRHGVLGVGVEVLVGVHVVQFGALLLHGFPDQPEGQARR